MHQVLCAAIWYFFWSLAVIRENKEAQKADCVFTREFTDVESKEDVRKVLNMISVYAGLVNLTVGYLGDTAEHPRKSPLL